MDIRDQIDYYLNTAFKRVNTETPHAGHNLIELAEWNRTDGFIKKDTAKYGDVVVPCPVIAIVDTPVLVAGTWTVERDSLFTGTTGGRITYNGERDIVLPIDITCTISAASGTNKDVHVYLALNGAIIANSGIQNRVGSTDPRNTTVMWQLNLSEDDFLEVFVENNSDTINLVISDAILRAR